MAFGCEVEDCEKATDLPVAIMCHESEGYGADNNGLALSVNGYAMPRMYPDTWSIYDNGLIGFGPDVIERSDRMLAERTLGTTTKL